MAESKEETKTDVKTEAKKEAVFSKERLIKSKAFAQYRDLLTVIVKDNEKITKHEGGSSCDQDEDERYLRKLKKLTEIKISARTHQGVTGQRFFAVLQRHCLRQRKDKFRPAPLGADHINIFPMCLYDLFYDRQPESCSLLNLTSGEIRLIEPVPDLLDTLFRNTDSRILHGNKDFLVLQRSLDIDYRVLTAEFDGVVNEIVHHLLDFPQVGIDHLDIIPECQIEYNIFGSAGSLKGGRRVLDDPVDIEVAPCQESLAVERVQRQHALSEFV